MDLPPARPARPARPAPPAGLAGSPLPCAAPRDPRNGIARRAPSGPTPARVRQVPRPTRATAAAASATTAAATMASSSAARSKLCVPLAICFKHRHVYIWIQESCVQDLIQKVGQLEARADLAAENEAGLRSGFGPGVGGNYPVQGEGGAN